MKDAEVQASEGQMVADIAYTALAMASLGTEACGTIRRAMEKIEDRAGV